MVFITRFLECYKYSNFPKSYIKRAMEQVAYRETRGIQGPKVTKKMKFIFTLDRPWTQEFKDANPYIDKRIPPLVEPIKDWKFFRGDRVEILIGKDKGKQGIINYIVRERNWVIVEGLNCTYEYVGPKSMAVRPLMKMEQPLLVPSEVSLVDPSDNQVTDVEWRYTEAGEKVRVSVRTGRIIPLSILDEETRDYKTKATYNEQPKDTKTKDFKEITFIPKIKTFEQEIMEEMGIVETRVSPPTYWY